MKKFIGLTALAAVALFVAFPSSAAAQQIVVGWGGYGPAYWPLAPRIYGGPWRPTYYYPVTRAYYYYPSTSYIPQDKAVDGNAVTIRVHVPSDARVWIEDVATSQTGADRTFLSPSLTPGSEYTYHIRVRWDEDGKPVERTRAVAVHAGDRVSLNIDK